MTAGRRPRRASSAPQRVGSDEGLRSSWPSITGSAADSHDDPRPDADGPSGERVPKSTAKSKRRRVEQTRDDTDTGWGERGDDDASARWLRENRPPHWG